MLKKILHIKYETSSGEKFLESSYYVNKYLANNGDGRNL